MKRLEETMSCKDGKCGIGKGKFVGVNTRVVFATKSARASKIKMPTSPAEREAKKTEEVNNENIRS